MCVHVSVSVHSPGSRYQVCHSTEWVSLGDTVNLGFAFSSTSLSVLSSTDSKLAYDQSQPLQLFYSSPRKELFHSCAELPTACLAAELCRSFSQWEEGK